MVEAEELSVPAILNGIRAGRTSVDLTASHDKVIDFEAESGGTHARMGETLRTAAGAPIHVKIYATTCAGSVVHLLVGGEQIGAVPTISVDSQNFNRTASFTAGEGRHWLRVEVRDGNGTLQLMRSPLSLNFPFLG